jgi:hypothetical protein
MREQKENRSLKNKKSETERGIKIGKEREEKIAR